MKHKITALLLSLILIIPSMSVFSFTDTDGTDYQAAVDVLSGLGIVGGYKDGTYKPQDNITRAEFAAILTRMLDTSVYTVPKTPIFTDVGKRHWALNYVNTGFVAGYFSGYGDGTFAPEEKIRFSEVVKTLVVILGYGDLAEVKGGYPSGYIAVAVENDLLKGISMDSQEYMTRGDVALFIYNCLDCPKLVQTVFGSDKVEYEKDASHTILTDEMNLSRHEGVICATKHTGLYGNGALGEDKVLINSVKIGTGNTDVSAYLGYSVVIYASRDDNTKKETAVFYELTDDNIEVTVVSDDIDTSTNLKYFSWWNGDKQESRVFSNSVQLVSNGKVNPYYSSADLKPDSGAVTILSNNGDKEVDIILVKKYTHYVVERTDTNNMVIYDKYGKTPLELEPADREVDYSIIRKGTPLKFKNLTKGSILSVVQSDDGAYMEIYVSTDVIRGSVTSVTDGGEYTIGEEQKSYKRSNAMPDDKLIKLGDTGLFYMDIEGRIIYADVSTAVEGNYAYLLNAGIEKGLDGRLGIKLLNSKGEIENLYVSEKVTFDGKRADFDEILAYLGGAGNITKQPIKYAKNEEGQISRIEIPNLTDERAGRTFRRGTRMFGYAETNGFFIKDEHTVMFQVPTTPSDDDRDYKVITHNDLQNYKTTYSVTGYDREKLVVGCAVLDVDDVSSVYNILYDACVLTQITTAVNEDGEKQTKLYFMQAGKMTSNVISENASLYNITFPEKLEEGPLSVSQLQAGDIFYIMLDGNKEIKSLARVLTIGDGNLSALPQFGGYSRGFSAEKAFGRPLMVEDNGLLLRVDGRGDYLFDFTKPQGRLYLYDIKTRTVRTATVADIMDIENAGDNAAYMYIACHTGEVTDAVIYYQPR